MDAVASCRGGRGCLSATMTVELRWLQGYQTAMAHCSERFGRGRQASNGEVERRACALDWLWVKWRAEREGEAGNEGREGRGT